MKLPIAVLAIAIGTAAFSGITAPATKPHWAFQPLASPPVPKVNDTQWAKTAVDPYVLSAIEEKKLVPSPAADKRTLIRRATFDLIGLPPTPEEVTAFLADNSPGAFAKVIDRLLASPHYGERWGRHWLDIVRYADTAGETADFPVPQAWRYRNYVIDSFNTDKPFDRFITEQLAGDILAAGAPPAQFNELITATGYLAISRRFGFDIAKDHFLTIEDTIDTLGKSFLGLTISCARCHDHKYDPIPQSDYYALYGIFQSTRYPFPGCEKEKAPRDMVSLKSSGEQLIQMNAWRERIAQLDQALAPQATRARELTAQLKTTRTVAPMTRVEGRLANGAAQSFVDGTNGAALSNLKIKKGELIELTLFAGANHGADSTTIGFDVIELDGAKRRWSLVDDALDDFFRVGTGSLRADRHGNTNVWRFCESAETLAPLPRFTKDLLNVPGILAWSGAEDWPSVFINTRAEPVKLTTVSLEPKSFVAHPGPRSHVTVAWRSPIDGRIAIQGRIADADATGGDGVLWQLDHRASDGETFHQLHLLARQSETLKRERVELAAAEPRMDLAYSVIEGKATNSPIHRRGDPEMPGEEVPRRFLTAFGGPLLSPEAGSGRAQLARWITTGSTAPLTARVMANRVWQHHFGRGLVRTPNDFGTRGLPPTNLALLDSLAAELIRSGWSVKSLHRLIMKSSTYQQSAGAHRSSDTDNVLFGRFDRRRLSAEEIRDGLLSVSGDLDRTPGTAHPFPTEKSWGFTQHTPFNTTYEINRRSVYLMVQRIKRHPFLALFDGADPNSSTAERLPTIVPTQALYFMNDAFFHARAQSFAASTMPLADDSARLDRAYQLAFSRSPTPAEHIAAKTFLNDYAAALAHRPAELRLKESWAAYARVILSSNEFIHVE